MFSLQQSWLPVYLLLHLLQQQHQILCQTSSSSTATNSKSTTIKSILQPLTLLPTAALFTPLVAATTVSASVRMDSAFIDKNIKYKVAPQTAYHSSKSRKSPSTKQRQRIKILSVLANCTRELLEMQLTMNTPFRGLLYAKDFPQECYARGTASNNIILRLPTSGCGVRAEPLLTADTAVSVGGMEYAVRIMLQMEPKLQQSTDILHVVRCTVPAIAMGMRVPGAITATATAAAAAAATAGAMPRNARTRNLGSAMTAKVDGLELNTQVQATKKATTAATATIASAATGAAAANATHLDTPRMRIWLELGGPNGTGSVEVGVATTLTVRAIVPGNIGVRVVDCAALDGLCESTQQLLDVRGCPIDEQVMPALHTHFKPAEEGWSKHAKEDLIERTFTATFPAFKFPDRERLHVSCGVQLCKGKCPNLNCHNVQHLKLGNNKHLARIEVFNSLAVTASQIEMDRFRYNRHTHNNSDEQVTNVRPLHSEGTLCLSISKLAISFCILGLIFLIAVIVAITSLLRTRRRHRHLNALNHNCTRFQRADICTSMFSTSSESAQSVTRFGSKLFIPYYPNTLAYGRVY